MELLKLAVETIKSNATIQIPHWSKFTIVWIIGTNKIEHVWTINCPEALHTATANRIRPKQHTINKRKIPPRTNDIDPYTVYYVFEPPEIVGIFIYPVTVLTSLIIPAL